MSDNKTSWILPVGGLALAYFFGTEILQALGIGKSDPNVNLLQNEPAFDPNFWTLKKPAVILGASNVALANDIYNSVHAFYANEPAVFIGAMQSMTTKAMVSKLCDVFQELYNVGMIPYLQQYLTPEQIQQGAKIVSQLPDYMPR